MTKAIITHTPSRRALLGGSSALLAGGAVAATPGASTAAKKPDSELLILCAEFHRTKAELDHWYATGWELEPAPRETEAHQLGKAENDRFFCANDDAFGAVVDMPAKTLAGVAAKSKVLAAAVQHVIKDGDATPYESFAYSLAQEAAKLAGGVA